MGKKITSITIVLSIVVLCISGCAVSKMTEGDTGKKVTISVGGWPASSTQPADANRYNDMLEAFNKKYPDIKVIPDSWTFNVDTFLTKAASGQLPTVYDTAFTEVDRIVNAGYAADITTYMNNYGYTNGIKPEILNMITRDKHIYMLPFYTYVMGLYANTNLFIQAGEVNADGTPKLPNTFEEMAQLAQRIKQKTGKAGFVLPTINNCGGWHFMNIAWAYGTEFMKQENGKWKATFNSPETVAALQYVKDLKWKYDALPSNALIDITEMQKTFATGQAAMFFAAPPQDQLTNTYKMDKDNIAIGLIPAGPKGKYTLMGGGLSVIKSGATDEEIDACFKWFEVCGKSPNLTEESKISMKNDYEVKTQENDVIGIEPYEFWINSEKLLYDRELRAKYTNTDIKKFIGFKNFENVNIRHEEAVNCQELYQVLDECIQAVLTNENSDPQRLIATAENDFQLNYLDK